MYPVALWNVTTILMTFRPKLELENKLMKKGTSPRLKFRIFSIVKNGPHELLALAPKKVSHTTRN
jgi:hypothetical protein